MIQARLFFFVLSALCSGTVHAARIKDIANVRGVRSNQLLGYGLVVGLKGTGDSPLEFTNQSFKRMLDKMGVKLTSEQISGKNVAAVIITADLPAFARSGNKLDITVSSIGDAASLKGGVLIQTPLKGGDQQVYAVAQGPVMIGEGGHTTVARVPQAAMIEKDAADDFSQKQMFRITLHDSDFTTSARVAKTINLDLGGQYASAIDGGTVDVVVPFSYKGKGVELMAGIESLPIETDSKARVVINEKTGTVVIGENVRVKRVAISHGDLTVKVNTPTLNMGGAALRGPASTSSSANAPGQAPAESKEKARIGMMDGSSNVGDLVRALNQFGVSPKDLISIFQNLKSAGALEAELEIL